MSRQFVSASSQYLNNATFSLSADPITIAALFNSSVLSQSQIICSIVDKDVGDQRLFLYLVSASDAVAISINNGAGSAGAVATSSYSQNTWHHACGIWTSSTSRAVYMDGGSKNTNTVSVTFPTGIDTASIGMLRDSSPSSPFNGMLAEVSIWNIDLTDAEVTILALGYSPLLVRPQNLITYWPIIGRTSPEIDIVGGFDLTLNNAPAVAEHPRVSYPTQLPYKIPASPLYTKSLAVLQAQQGVPPTSNFAVLALRNRHPVLAFDDTTAKSTVFDFVMTQQYTGGQIAVILHSSAATATSGNAKAGVSLERVGDGQQDVDSDGFAGVNNRTFLVPATSGFVKQTRIEFASGADMDSIATGEKFRLKVTRLAADTADDMSGDWELHMAEIRGT